MMSLHRSSRNKGTLAPPSYLSGLSLDNQCEQSLSDRLVTSKDSITQVENLDLQWRLRSGLVGIIFFEKNSSLSCFSAKKEHQPCLCITWFQYPRSVVNPGWSKAANGQWNRPLCNSFCRCNRFSFTVGPLAVFYSSFVSLLLVTLHAFI